MEIEDPVVAAAQIAFSVRLKDSSDVSENTKNAQAIAKAWRSAVHRGIWRLSVSDAQRLVVFREKFRKYQATQKAVQANAEAMALHRG